MTALKLPQWVISEIDKARCRFLWHGAGDHIKGYNLVDWESVCHPKKVGGLGVIDLKTFNQTLLLKWCWWWYEEGHRLWKPLMQQTAAIMDGLPIAHPFSAISNRVISFFNNNTRWIPGSGSTISLWNHNWGEGIMKDNLPNLFSFALDTQITLRRAATIPQNSTTSLFRANLSIEAQEELTLLCTLMRGVQLQHDQKDVIAWKGIITGSFTVKSAYGLIKSGPRIKTTIHRIWKVEGPPRMKVFGWLAIHNSILTHDNLQKRGWEIVSRCVLCKKEMETGKHLFQECPYTLQLYEKLKNTYPALQWPASPTIQINYRDKMDKIKREVQTTVLVMQFVIWREHCARSFTHNSKDTHELLQEVVWQLELTKKSGQQHNRE